MNFDINSANNFHSDSKKLKIKDKKAKFSDKKVFSGAKNNKKGLGLALGIAGLILLSYFVLENYNRLNWNEEKEMEVMVTENYSIEENNLEDFFALWQEAYGLKSPVSVYKSFLDQDKGRFKNTPVFREKEEIIYGSDLNYYFLFHYFYNYVWGQQVSETAINKVEETIRNDSRLIQAAAEKGIIELNSNFFNSDNKDYILRSRMLNEARKNLR